MQRTDVRDAHRHKIYVNVMLLLLRCLDLVVSRWSVLFLFFASNAQAAGWLILFFVVVRWTLCEAHVDAQAGL